jgi:hypothetical protein
MDQHDCIMTFYCSHCGKEIASTKEWTCVTCPNVFDENCYIDQCVSYDCEDLGQRQCEDCIISGKERLYCMEDDCCCANQQPLGISKKKARRKVLKKLYQDRFGI